MRYCSSIHLDVLRELERHRSAGFGTVWVALQLVRPGSLGTFASNRDAQALFSPGENDRSALSRRCRLRNRPLVPYKRGPKTTALPAPASRAPAIYSPSPVTQRRELRHRGVASCPSTWQLDARAIRHPRHPFLSTPSRRLRVIVVFTISISHLIRYARATGIKYHSADSTSVFLLVPSSSCPSPVAGASRRREGRRGEFKDICAMPPVMFTILQCDVNSGNER